MIRLEEMVSIIYWISNGKVKLDRDLANLYGLKIKALKQSVKRKIQPFQGWLLICGPLSMRCTHGYSCSSPSGLGGVNV